MLSHFKIHPHKLFVFFLIVLPAFFSLFKYAHSGLNADILLNQIMSLQNPTLFYWGQNRIFNIIPYTLSFISFPILNLFMALFITSLSFFGSLYLFSYISGKVIQSTNGNIYAVYIINVLLCIVFLTDNAWISMCIWHFEYSLALIFMSISIYLFYYKKSRIKPLVFILAFLATGINPFIIILFSAIILFKCFINLSINKNDLSFLISNIMFFLIWLIIAKYYGSFDDYSTLVVGNYYDGTNKLVVNLLSDYLYIGNLIIFTFFNLCIYVLKDKFCLHKISIQISLAKSIVIYSLILSCFIVAVVACIRWTQMNDFSPRYLIFCIFIALFANSFWLCSYLMQIRIKEKSLYIFTIISFIGSIILFYPPDFNLKKCKIYQECDNISQSGNNFYLGDYWKAWACASRDLNNGHAAHTLVYRATANKNKIMADLHAALDDNGCLEIQCINSDMAFCKKQMDGYFSQYNILDAEYLNANNIKIKFCNLRQK